ncbi:MAG TPA: response regulator [Candidatus Melainabacteria bacterium]|nr:response regulator [Candidatus Melainabacteria bacterium]
MKQASGDSLTHQGDPPHVLLVEDNFVNQKVATVLLQRLGLKVKITSNGREAVEAVSNHKFDLILMDCHMPIMDGFEATVAIREIEARTNTYSPIIAVTALAMSGDRERCIAAGMDDYLSKPIDIDLLKAKVNHWLRTEVVCETQKQRRKVLRPKSPLTLVKNEPLDMAELEEFYEPEQLTDMMDMFLNDTNDMLSKVKQHMEEKNSKLVAALAHEIKASCASIGAKNLARLCLYLEQTACRHDWIEAEETATSIEREFAALRDYIQSHMPAESAK